MSRPQKPTAFLSREEMDEIDMAAVREAAVISWLLVLAGAAVILLTLLFVGATLLFGME